jgi:glycosyltransferase involved in cell wall biosynthesis
LTLRVAVDATAIPGQRVGAGVYVTELLKAMDTLGLDLHVFVNSRDATEFGSMLPRATLHAMAATNRIARLAWAHAVLPLRVRRIAPSVFHGPHYTLPGRLGLPSVVTFHDPTFFTLPELHERAKVAYFTRAARSGIDRATRVIAVSEYARRGAIDHGHADPDHVDVVLEGVDTARYSPAEGAGRAFPFEPYILFVGALEPRKNVPALVAAYAALVAAGLPHHLVLVGPRAWGATAVDEATATLPPGRVHQLSYVEEDEKIELYRHAAVLAYPTLAEGFGLPVLEAMACGTPVVTTSGSAPEEFASDSAVLVPPRDTEALRDALERVLSDTELSGRLRRVGPERARNLTWQRAAEATVEVYERATCG